MDTVYTVLIVDARSRERNCFVASATELPNKGGIVLRKAGGNIGNVEKLHGQTVEYPILVVGSYQAQSSAGYTAQFYRGEVFREVTWVGGAGFGFSSENEVGKKIHRGYGLRPFGYPLTGTLIPAGARVCCVETHNNSNPNTASAAFSALDLMVKVNSNLFLLAEGQSDYTSATSFEVAEDALSSEFPDEHRAEDIFSSERILEAGIRRAVGSEPGREGRIALRYALLNTVISLGRRPNEANDFMATVSQVILDLLGDEEIGRIVEKRYADLLESGWKFGFDMTVSNHFIRAYSPDGEETSGNALFGDKEIEEHFLCMANAMHEEGFSGLTWFRNSEISEVLGSYYWSQWATKGSFSNHDFLVEAWFEGEGEPTRLWFPQGDYQGPNGEPSNGCRFLSAWDHWNDQDYLWQRLIELDRMIVTAYTEGREVVESREWLASHSNSPYVQVK